MSTALAQTFWREANGVASLAHADLRDWWLMQDHPDIRAVREQMNDFLPDLISLYGEIGAAAALDMYDELRDMSPEVDRVYTATMPAKVMDVEQVQSAGRWALSPLLGADPNPAAALTQLEGVTRRLVHLPAREVVLTNTRRDPSSRGWKRIGNGDSCEFCRMLIDRKGVYTDSTVRFAAHDDCGCMALPSFARNADPVAVKKWKK